MMKIGETVKVVQIMGSGHLARTLGHMGIIAGEEVTIMHKATDSVIVRVKETRYALGTGAAGMVLVQPI
jgi:ferrous iron transport protein A